MADPLDKVQDDLAGDRLHFSILKASGNVSNNADSSGGPRLGQLKYHRGSTINTPNFIALTSRGVVPHISQDNFASKTEIEGVHIALEDCMVPFPSQTKLTSDPLVARES
jgi:queuine tRNA-ribosyltransferase accessory subunit